MPNAAFRRERSSPFFELVATSGEDENNESDEDND
jgi:hypothetical protein